MGNTCTTDIVITSLVAAWWYQLVHLYDNNFSELFFYFTGLDFKFIVDTLLFFTYLDVYYFRWKYCLI